MNIREAKIEDWKEVSVLMGMLQDLHAEQYPMIFKKAVRRDKTYFEKTLKNPKKKIFIADDNGKIVGYVKGKILIEEESDIRFGRIFGYIDSIYVLESYRGLLIDQKLFARLFRWMRENGVTYAEGGVWEFNSSARAVFEQMGSKTYQRKQIIFIDIY